MLRRPKLTVISSSPWSAPPASSAKPLRKPRAGHHVLREWPPPTYRSGLIALSLVGVLALGSCTGTLDSLTALLPGSGCSIKGNISLRTGERIYHLPGQRYYYATRISAHHGERWFCSEAGARQAGWRRSRV